ncbi:MAG: DUF4404 family protein [Thermoguttaceae bacterium]
MQQENLQKTLEQLRCELSTLGPEAAPVKDHVNSLINDLEQQLQDLDKAEHRETIRGRLVALVEQFEREHPSITSLLDRIITFLANMGV